MSFNGPSLDLEIELRGKRIGIHFSMNDDRDAAQIQMVSDKEMAPIDVELALYQAAHALAEATRTGNLLQEAKSIWM